MKIKIKRWYLMLGDNSYYELDLTKEDVNETEIWMCIDEQVYGNEQTKQKEK